ncbi:MAG: GIY-YIG nuclease family protein [Candidatus Paceibacterota bacterium]
MYYVYIIESLKDQTRYVGHTSHTPSKRLDEHNRGLNAYTKARAPYKIVWYGAFLEKQKAKAFEEYLKHGSGHAFAKKRLV